MINIVIDIKDVFSKYAWVVPMKDKTGKTLVIAFISVLKTGRCPKSLQTEEGTVLKKIRNLMMY